MNLIEEVQKIGAGIGAEIKEKKGVYKMTAVIAERKAFLSKKKLTYIAKFRVDDAAKEVRFTETLMEQGSGLGAGSSSFDSDGGMSPGFGFKAESFSSGMGGRSGSIEELSNLFGKQFTYKFNYGEIRKKVEALAAQAGYKFTYKITGLGL